MLSYFEISIVQYVSICLVGFLIGMSKTGLKGINMISIIILANAFGGRTSSGILLLMLSVGDLFAVAFYKRHAEWKHLKAILPWTLAGIFIGLVFGANISDTLFRQIMGGIIIVCLVIMVYREIRSNNNIDTHHILISVITGLLGGFSTMIGNVAGAIISIYFLSTGMGKNEFLGTTAWFFLIINLFKIPLHVIFWKTITVKTFLMDLSVVPVIIMGAIIGYFLVKKIPEKPFKYLVIIVTFVSSIKLFL